MENYRVALNKKLSFIKSAGVAAGFLISAFHSTGLFCLAHAPSPLVFLTSICGGPTYNEVTVLLAVGHPADNSTFPRAS